MCSEKSGYGKYGVSGKGVLACVWVLCVVRERVDGARVRDSNTSGGS